MPVKVTLEPTSLMHPPEEACVAWGGVCGEGGGIA